MISPNWRMTPLQSSRAGWINRKRQKTEVRSEQTEIAFTEASLARMKCFETLQCNVSTLRFFPGPSERAPGVKSVYYIAWNNVLSLGRKRRLLLRRCDATSLR